MDLRRVLTSEEVEKLFADGTVILFKCEVTQDFPLIFISNNCGEILGFDSSYFLNNRHGWSDCIHPDDRASVVSQFRQVIKEGGGAIVEYRFKRKDGTYIWLRDEFKLITDENGAAAILGSSFDITDRKSIEIELRESKEQYQSVVEHIKDVTYHIDEHMNWTFLNQAWVEVTDHPLQEVLGKPFLEFIHAEDRGICERICNDLLKDSGNFHSCIVRLLKRNGSYIWVEMNARKTKDTAACKNSDISGTLVNVTAEMAKQKEIEELNRTLERCIAQRSDELNEEIEKRKQAQENVRKRLTYEQVISRCSSLLLESSESDAVDRALSLLLDVSDADRVYIFENYEGEDGRLYVNQIYEACGKKAEPQIDNPELQNMCYDDLPWWYKKLSQNRIINAIVEKIPSPEKEILQSQDIKSVLALPVFVDQEWFGFIGFDNVWEEEVWDEEDIMLLKTASEIIATYKKRQLVQKSLMRQKDYTQAIMDSLPSIYLAMDENLKMIHWNKNAEELTGYSHDEIEKMSVFDFVVPGDHQKLVKATNRLKRGEGIGTELKIRTKRGEEVDFFWGGRFIQLEEEWLLLCVGLDITSQKKTKRELINEKRYSEAIIESLPGIFYMMDEQGNYLKWNKNFTDQSGYSSEEIAGMYPSDLFEGEDLENVTREIQRVFEEGEADAEAVVLTKNGSEIPYYLTGKRFEQNGKQYLIGSGYNISEKKRAIEKLKKSEELFRNLFLKAPAAIVMADVENKVLKANQSFEELFGYTESEITGEDLNRIIIPEKADDEIPTVPENNSKVAHSYHQVCRKAKNGEMKDVFVGVIPIYVDDKPYVVFGMYIDVTEQKRYENQIADSLKEKQVLLQEIHHRVKNNLAVISGLLQLQTYEVEDADVRQTLQESQSRIQTMALIHEKLYQSQNLSRISCRSYIGELIQTIQTTFKTNAKKVDIDTQIEDVELNINQAVPFALLLNEVISNSFEHAFPGRKRGTLSVRLYEEDDRIYVNITDDGVGVPHDLSIGGEGSLGMTLIHNFLKQLEAEWELSNENGTSLSLTFSKEYVKGSSTTIV